MGQLDELPRMQFHLFVPWDVSPNVCRRCGQLPQAHPSPEMLAKIEAGEVPQ